mgnify:CR=1 FL=1
MSNDTMTLLNYYDYLINKPIIDVDIMIMLYLLPFIIWFVIIYPRMKTKQLKQLEQDGLINRKVYAQIPPKVEYSLTDIGKKFQSVLNELEIWGNDYIEYLKENKEAV